MTVRFWNAETTVNLTTAGDQDVPVSTTLNNGNYVVVWYDGSITANNGDVVARIFAPDGTPVTGEKIVTNTTQSEIPIDVTALGDGGFEVSLIQGANERNNRFSATGVAVPANNDGYNGVDSASLAAIGSQGGYAVAITSANGEIGLGIATDAGVLGSASTVNTTTAGKQQNPDLIKLSNGNLLVTWSTNDVDLRGRVFGPAGASAPVTPEFQINTTDYTHSDSEPAKLAALQDGAFAAVWATLGSAAPGDPKHYEARARIFNVVNGVVVAAGPDFLVSASLASQSDFPIAVPVNHGAGFMVLWSGASGLAGQVFDALGRAQGGEFVVSTEGNVADIAATTLADGRVSVQWDLTSGDASGYGVHQVILDPRDGIVTGTAGADTLYGGSSDDQVTAGAGADTVYAGAGNDFVAGGSGNDFLYGQLGDDTILGGSGQDYLNGGPGSDTFVLPSYLDSPAATPDGIGDFQHGTDVIDLRGAALGLVALVHDGAGNTIVGFAPPSAGAPPQGSVFVIGDVEAPDVLADAGTFFYIVGSALAETLIGGAGGDFIQGGGGADYLAGGGGADVFKYTGFADSPAATPDVIGDFQHGMDKIDFTGGGAGTAVNLVHGTGVTYVYFAPGGTAAKGLIVAYGDVEAADVKVDSGVTVVTSGLGGGDVLTTSGNTDLLMGGAGKDTFQVGKLSDSTPTSPDVIEGFQSGVDKIDLSAVSGGAVNIIRDGAWSYVVYAPDGDTADGLIVVHGAVTPADLGAQPGAAVFVSHASIDAALHPEPTPDHTRVFLY